MMKLFTTILAGLILGAILAATQYYSPVLLPWAVGYMLAALAVNTRILTQS